MKIKGNRFVTSILAASMLSGTFFVPASAGELEGESAIAGMAVTLNNYYAGAGQRPTPPAVAPVRCGC